MLRRSFLLWCTAGLPALKLDPGASRPAGRSLLLVTVINKRSLKPLTGLQPADFIVRAGGRDYPVLSALEVREPIDVLLVIDASMVGEMTASLAPQLVTQLAEKEQMAIIAYDTSADLIQDFTSTSDRLRAALAQIRFGNNPRLLDALYAAISEGFRGATYRRVLLLLTSGAIGPNRVSPAEVIRLARQHSVSIYCLYTFGSSSRDLEQLSTATGGVAINLRNLSKRTPDPARHIFEILRHHYRIEIPPLSLLAEDVTVTLRRPDRKDYLCSVLPLD